MLVAAVLGTALAYMSDDMLNLAIPSVAREFGASVSDAQWILNAHYLSLVSGVLVAGALGDIVGRRRIFLGGILLFSTGAVGCAVAPAIWPLVAGRFVRASARRCCLPPGWRW